MKQYLLGIDNGGSEIKCVLFDTAGTEVASARRRLPLSMPQPGFTERDGDAVWQANAEAIREVVQKAGVPAKDIAAVGLTGYGNGTCLVDENGKSTYPCIVSTDTRARSYGALFAENGAERAIYPMTCQSIWAAQPAALLPWFKDNMPEVLEKSHKALGIKDFVRYHLTGEFAMEITEASSTCLCNLDKRDWDEAIFKALGISQYQRLMPKVVESDAVSGYVSAAGAAATGLAEGTPVAGGYFDIDAGAFASGILDEDTLCLIAGTWSINEYLAKTANRDYDKNANTVTLSYLPGYYLVEDSSPTSASNFDWFVEHVMAVDRPGAKRGELYEECNTLLADTKPEDSDVVFVPYLFDSNTTPGARATFMNLGGHHTRAEMLQAVYEGVVFSTALHVKNLPRSRDSFRSARLSGGVANSAVWAQMMADVLQVPVEVLAGGELSAQGAAMGAALAAGVFKNHADAVQSMVHLKGVYQPDAGKKDIYEQKFAAFERALEALAVFHE